MTLAEYTDHICSKLGKTDAVSTTLCKHYLRRHYKTIWDAALWRDSLVLVSKLANDDELIMPEVVEKVVRVRYDASTPLYGVDQQVFFDVDSSLFDGTGTPAAWSALTPVATAIHPADETLSIVSSDTDDTEVQVWIRGEKDGVPKRESVTLNGTTPVVTTNQWDVIHSLSKEETEGTVTIIGVTSGALLLTLWPEESEKKYRRIRLHLAPAQSTKYILVLGKRRFQPLQNDLDTPLLADIDNALICLATADMLERMRQYGKAQMKMQEGGVYLSAMKKQVQDQEGIIAQIVPTYSGEPDAFAL